MFTSLVSIVPVLFILCSAVSGTNINKIDDHGQIRSRLNSHATRLINKALSLRNNSNAICEHDVKTKESTNLGNHIETSTNSFNNEYSKTLLAKPISNHEKLIKSHKHKFDQLFNPFRQPSRKFYYEPFINAKRLDDLTAIDKFNTIIAKRKGKEDKSSSSKDDILDIVKVLMGILNSGKSEDSTKSQKIGNIDIDRLQEVCNTSNTGSEAITTSETTMDTNKSYRSSTENASKLETILPKFSSVNCQQEKFIACSNDYNSECNTFNSSHVFTPCLNSSEIFEPLNNSIFDTTEVRESLIYSSTDLENLIITWCSSVGSVTTPLMFSDKIHFQSNNSISYNVSAVTEDTFCKVSDHDMNTTQNFRSNSIQCEKCHTFDVHKKDFQTIGNYPMCGGTDTTESSKFHVHSDRTSATQVTFRKHFDEPTNQLCISRFNKYHNGDGLHYYTVDYSNNISLSKNSSILNTPPKFLDLKFFNQRFNIYPNASAVDYNSPYNEISHMNLNQSARVVTTPNNMVYEYPTMSTDISSNTINTTVGFKDAPCSTTENNSLHSFHSNLTTSSIEMKPFTNITPSKFTSFNTTTNPIILNNSISSTHTDSLIAGTGDKRTTSMFSVGIITTEHAPTIRYISPNTVTLKSANESDINISTPNSMRTSNDGPNTSKYYSEEITSSTFRPYSAQSSSADTRTSFISKTTFTNSIQPKSSIHNTIYSKVTTPYYTRTSTQNTATSNIIRPKVPVTKNISTVTTEAIMPSSTIKIGKWEFNVTTFTKYPNKMTAMKFNLLTTGGNTTPFKMNKLITPECDSGTFFSEIHPLKDFVVSNPKEVTKLPKENREIKPDKSSEFYPQTKISPQTSPSTLSTVNSTTSNANKDLVKVFSTMPTLSSPDNSKTGASASKTGTPVTPNYVNPARIVKTTSNPFETTVLHRTIVVESPLYVTQYTNYNVSSTKSSYVSNSTSSYSTTEPQKQTFGNPLTSSSTFENTYTNFKVTTLSKTSDNLPSKGDTDTQDTQPSVYSELTNIKEGMPTTSTTFICVPSTLNPNSDPILDESISQTIQNDLDANDPTPLSLISILTPPTEESQYKKEVMNRTDDRIRKIIETPVIPTTSIENTRNNLDILIEKFGESLKPSFDEVEEDTKIHEESSSNNFSNKTDDWFESSWEVNSKNHKVEQGSLSTLSVNMLIKTANSDDSVETSTLFESTPELKDTDLSTLSFKPKTESPDYSEKVFFLKDEINSSNTNAYLNFLNPLLFQEGNPFYTLSPDDIKVKIIVMASNKKNRNQNNFKTESKCLKPEVELEFDINNETEEAVPLSTVKDEMYELTDKLEENVSSEPIIIDESNSSLAFLHTIDPSSKKKLPFFNNIPFFSKLLLNYPTHYKIEDTTTFSTITVSENSRIALQTTSHPKRYKLRKPAKHISTTPRTNFVRMDIWFNRNLMSPDVSVTPSQNNRDHILNENDRNSLPSSSFSPPQADPSLGHIKNLNNYDKELISQIMTSVLNMNNSVTQFFLKSSSAEDSCNELNDTELSSVTESIPTTQLGLNLNPKAINFLFNSSKSFLKTTNQDFKNSSKSILKHLQNMSAGYQNNELYSSNVIPYLINFLEKNESVAMNTQTVATTAAIKKEGTIDNNLSKKILLYGSFTKLSHLHNANLLYKTTTEESEAASSSIIDDSFRSIEPILLDHYLFYPVDETSTVGTDLLTSEDRIYFDLEDTTDVNGCNATESSHKHKGEMRLLPVSERTKDDHSSLMSSYGLTKYNSSTQVKQYISDICDKAASIANKNVITHWNHVTNMSHTTYKVAMVSTLELTHYQRVQNHYLDTLKDVHVGDPILEREIKLLYLPGMSILPDIKIAVFEEMLYAMDSIFSAASVTCWSNPSVRYHLPEIKNAMTTSNIPEELNYYWTEWRNVTGKKIRRLFEQYVELMNLTAVSNG